MDPRKLFFALVLLASTGAHASELKIIPAQSMIQFTVREMGVPIKGVFRKFDGDIDIDLKRPERSKVMLRIDTGSLSTDNEEADAVATDGDWMDKLRFPHAVFTSESASRVADDRFVMNGKLKIKGIERKLSVPFHLSPQANGSYLVNCEFTLNRNDYGVGGGVWNEEGIVAKEIPVQVRLMLQPVQHAASR